MNEIQKRIEQIAKKRKNRLEGKYNCIPFYHHFPRLSKYIPGLFKGCLYTILSGTGIGKSKFARYLNIILPYEIKKKNSKFKYRVIFFSLEESKEEFIDNMIVYVLKLYFKISIDVLHLNSMYENTFDEATLEAIRKTSEYVQDMLQNVDIIDTIDNPTGMYFYCKEVSQNLGTHHYKTLNIHGKDTKVYSHYVPNDPEEYVIVVADHIGLLSEETDRESGRRLQLAECMKRWTSDYALKHLTKHYNWIVCNVQQTTMTSDDLSHYKAGKLEPSISDGGDNKRILRDSKLIISLFAPDRYELESYDGYNIKRLLDWFRSIKVLKNRYGMSNIKVGMLFDGASGKFRELPLPQDEVQISQVYKQLQNMQT